MSFYVVVGAGSTGTATAHLLAEAGEQVLLVTRRGTGPAHPNIERVAADAADPSRLTALLTGARTLINAAMPAYDRWPTDFPPLANSLLTAAERSGADYVMLGNIYGYGPFTGRATEDLPMAATTVKGIVRARMWTDALAAHAEGRVRVTEVRGNDFIGPDAVSPYTLFVLSSVLAGTKAVIPADLDVPHSWTYTIDAARTLIAAAQHPDSWGRAWHVPSTSEATMRELTDSLAAAAGSPAPQLHRMPVADLLAAAETDSMMAELPEMLYLYDRPSLMDASTTEKTLGIRATPLDEALKHWLG